MADTVNPYEIAARQRKAKILAEWIVDAMRAMTALTEGEAIDAAARFCWRASDAAWEAAAEDAEVNMPSVETRAQVLACIEGMRMAEAEARHTSAFAGLPGS